MSDTPADAGADSGPRPDADAAMVAGEEVPSERIALSRDRIVDAALAHLEEVGLTGLTMRKLGQRMGVEAMAIYHYVPGKEELLDAIVEHLIDGMYADPEVIRAPERGWQDFLVRLAHGVRRVALAHSRAFPLVASRPTEAPWLRPPLRSLDWVETFLAGLRQEGFSDPAAAAAYRAFSSFLLGTLLLEVASRGADIGPLDVVEDEQNWDERLPDHPTVRDLRRHLSEDHSASEFEDALDDLLDRVARLRVELDVAPSADVTD